MPVIVRESQLPKRRTHDRDRGPSCHLKLSSSGPMRSWMGSRADAWRRFVGGVGSAEAQDLIWPDQHREHDNQSLYRQTDSIYTQHAVDISGRAWRYVAFSLKNGGRAHHNGFLQKSPLGKLQNQYSELDADLGKCKMRPWMVAWISIT